MRLPFLIIAPGAELLSGVPLNYQHARVKFFFFFFLILNI